MSDVLSEAQTRLWSPAGIIQQDVDGLVGRLMSRDVDVGELYFQYQRHRSRPAHHQQC